MHKKNTYDFYLILATTVVLFIISTICIYGMFYFKFAALHQMPALEKIHYMDRMNTIISPFLIALILLLGVCVPKRLLPTALLNRFAAALVGLAIIIGLVRDSASALAFVLCASLILQLIVCVKALRGDQNLHFEKKGYLVRLGSCLLHMGLILFVLDLLYYEQQTLHRVLFWIMAAAVVMGMLLCFYAETVHNLIRTKPKNPL